MANIVDAPARLNICYKCLDAGEAFDHVRVTVENSIPVALSAKEIYIITQVILAF